MVQAHHLLMLMFMFLALHICPKVHVVHHSRVQTCRTHRNKEKSARLFWFAHIFVLYTFPAQPSTSL